MKRSRRPQARRREPPRGPVSIASGWRSYDEMVLPPDASDLQRTETRLAFYAGASALFHGIMKALTPGVDATDADLAMMDTIQAEIEAFGATFDNEVERRRPGSVAAARAAPKHSLGDAPIEATYAEKMNVMAGALDEYFNGKIGGPDRKTGFVLLVFPFGDDEGRTNFISNGADRRDIVTLFREMIARFEGQPEMSGRA